MEPVNETLLLFLCYAIIVVQRSFIYVTILNQINGDRQAILTCVKESQNLYTKYNLYVSFVAD